MSRSTFYYSNNIITRLFIINAIIITNFASHGTCFTITNKRFDSSSSLKNNNQNKQRQQRSFIRPTITTTQLDAVSQRQVVIIDGAEYRAIKSSFSPSSSSSSSSSTHGTLTITTGLHPSTKKPIIGIECPPSSSPTTTITPLSPSVSLYTSSIATLPPSLTPTDATSTLLASLTLHAALPRLTTIGGSSSTSLVAGKVLIVGGGDYAAFLARGCRCWDVDVTVVTTTTTGGDEVFGGGVAMMGPSVGEMAIGFCDAVGEFDVLIDTLDDEGGDVGGSGGVVDELKRRYKCQKYISTFNNAQKIVRDNGVLFGPGETKSYARDISSRILSLETLGPPPPPTDDDFSFSTTLQKLFDENVIYKSKDKINPKEVYVRGWSLKDFWELASWPMNTEGSINSRFGLPVVDDILRRQQQKDEEDDEEKRRNKPATYATADDANPYVHLIRGIPDLQKDILTPRKTSVLFLSASWCRTCRKLTPQYNRMARQYSSSTNETGGGTTATTAASSTDDDATTTSSLTFAKTQTDSKIGKELSHMLDVDNVPTFVMFREGSVYGRPMSVTRLPSRRLNRALELLVEGEDWDEMLENEEGEESRSVEEDDLI